MCVCHKLNTHSLSLFSPLVSNSLIFPSCQQTSWKNQKPTTTHSSAAQHTPFLTPQCVCVCVCFTHWPTGIFYCVIIIIIIIITYLPRMQLCCVYSSSRESDFTDVCVWCFCGVGHRQTVTRATGLILRSHYSRYCSKHLYTGWIYSKMLHIRCINRRFKMHQTFGARATL